MRLELLKILRTRPGAETANKLDSQRLEFRAFYLERNARPQMLKAADGRAELGSSTENLGNKLPNRRKPLAGKMVEDGDMRVQEIARRRKVLSSEVIERLDVIVFDMSSYDHWR